MLLVQHTLWGTIGLPLLYIPLKSMVKIPALYPWSFQTKLQQAVDLMRWAAELALAVGKSLWMVVEAFTPKVRS